MITLCVEGWQLRLQGWAGGASIGVRQPGPRAGFSCSATPLKALRCHQKPPGTQRPRGPRAQGAGTEAWTCLLRSRCECEVAGRRLRSSSASVCCMYPPSSGGLPWWLSGKESTCQCRRLGFPSWVRKIPWRRKWQPTPAFPGRSHGQRRQAGCSPWGHKRVGHDLVTKKQHLPLVPLSSGYLLLKLSRTNK